MRFAPLDQYVGLRPVQNFFNPADDVPVAAGLGPPVIAVPMGTVIKAVDPYWGHNEFIYVRANGAIRAFGLCVITPTFNSTDGRWRYEATEVPVTANLGRSAGVALRAMAAGQYGWLCVGGLTPVDCNASVAADTTFGIGAAGQGGALAAGRQVLNARIVAPGSTTVAKTLVLTGGSTLARITGGGASIDGWFVGAFIAGTGIPAAATIAGIDPDNRTITLSAAATASGGVTATVTYNNATIFYNVAHLNRPFFQGAIT